NVQRSTSNAQCRTQQGWRTMLETSVLTETRPHLVLSAWRVSDGSPGSVPITVFPKDISSKRYEADLKNPMIGFLKFRLTPSPNRAGACTSTNGRRACAAIVLAGDPNNVRSRFGPGRADEALRYRRDHS